jgi:hypothetical protein
MVLVVPQATGIPVGRRSVVTGELPANSVEQENYDKLIAAILESQHNERRIEDLQANAHCPFQVFYIDNVFEIVCDRLQKGKCTGGSEDICVNCHQAYAKVGNRRRVRVGCIYHPDIIGEPVNAMDSNVPRIE